MESASQAPGPAALEAQNQPAKRRKNKRDAHLMHQRPDRRIELLSVVRTDKEHVPANLPPVDRLRPEGVKPDAAGDRAVQPPGAGYGNSESPKVRNVDPEDSADYEVEPVLRFPLDGGEREHNPLSRKKNMMASVPKGETCRRRKRTAGDVGGFSCDQTICRWYRTTVRAPMPRNASS